jgi:hypothetical protein
VVPRTTLCTRASAALAALLYADASFHGVLCLGAPLSHLTEDGLRVLDRVGCEGLAQ